MAMDSLLSNGRRLSYSRRLFLWLLGYSLVLVGCFIFFQYRREKEFKADEVNARLQLVNRFILSQLEAGKNIREIATDDFHPFDNLRISVLDRQGEILFDNYSDSIPHTNHAMREEVREAIAFGSGYAVHRHSATTGDTYFYSALRSDNGLIVRTALPYSVNLNSLLEADYGFLRVMGVVALTMCILGYFATRRLGQTIVRLNSFARSAEHGERISDIEPFPHNELGDISNHIVRLYAGLQQANADRDREHRRALHQQQEKERIKKQLTNNINHELKTPVASIQVCLETLLGHPDMAPDKRQEFLQRAMTNCTRLDKLLADVSVITRMDDGGAAITLQPVDLARIIDDCVTDRRERADEKGIEIHSRIDEKLPITGNPSLLLSIFSNLLDNAIAYSGGRNIHIEQLAADSERIVIAFYDDGSGVPSQHLPRLFERFYRIDKGRSRAAGGTGLGLAIVKNAVLFHKGSISVESPVGSGLRFTITLRRNPDA